MGDLQRMRVAKRFSQPDQEPARPKKNPRVDKIMIQLGIEESSDEDSTEYEHVEEVGDIKLCLERFVELTAEGTPIPTLTQTERVLCTIVRQRLDQLLRGC